jgi:hypothetical protein
LDLDIDFTVPHAVRVYDYLLGGTGHFAADRAAAAALGVAYGGLDNAKAHVRANSDYMTRLVRYLVDDAGQRQFLNIGTVVPIPENAHAQSQAFSPETRVVYVDPDPIVLAHAHALLGDARDRADFVVADVRQPELILERAQATLDFTQPVAIVITNLHFVGHDEDPYGIVARLLDGATRGSYLAMCHLANDLQPPERNAALEELSASMRETLCLRSHADVGRFFDGLGLVEPGVVPVSRWRSNASASPSVGHGVAPFYGGLGQKP